MPEFWVEQGESRHAYEREALAWVKSWFPQREPWRAFARFTFPSADGQTPEIDLLVAGPTGCFLIEFKGYEGRLSGNARDLVSTLNGRRHAFVHPKPLLKRKIDQLVEALRRTEAYKKKRGERPPFIEPLVFMHHASALEIDSSGAIGVLLRDREGPDGTQVDGLKAALLERKAPWMQPLENGERRVDKPAAKLLTAALKQIAFFGEPPQMVAGSWELGASPVEEAAVWSDFEATHKLTKEQRTVRVYVAPRGQQLERERLANNARLEYEALRSFDHAGVLKVHELDECEMGFAIICEHTKGFIRLDHFILTGGASLDFGQRLGLLRQLCEAVSAAHDRGIAHRALSPSAVLVAQPDSEKPTIKLRNWHRRVRTDVGGTSKLQTIGGETITDVAATTEDLSEVERTYLAPELRSVGETGGIGSDIFSLGALGHLIFTGQPPAQTLEELDSALIRQQHLALSQHINGASASLERFIARSAHASPMQRATTVRELIEWLDRVQDELARPEFSSVSGPDDLVKDSVLDGGTAGKITVVRRLGSGGTAVGFEVSCDSSAFALKVARTPELNSRIDAEARTLEALKHDHIVSLVGKVDVGACNALLLWPFGHETLFDHLKRDGSLQLEFLERWGTQLLRAVEHLENEGKSHRDIKPGNIAITDKGQKKAQQVVLFDFSLAGLDADNLQAGTPGYIDPFLGIGNRKKWDRAAERYATGITLYEMATGVRPEWGDGKTLPKLLSVDHPNLDADLLPDGVRASLLTFFQRALHRDAAKRFDSATAMRESWAKALEGNAITLVGTQTADGKVQSLDEALDAAVAGAGLQTIIPSLPLSMRSQNVLHRLGVDTIEDLLHRSPHSLRWIPGVGSITQKELSELYQAARSRFHGVQVIIRTPEGDAEARATSRTGSGRRGRQRGEPADPASGAPKPDTTLELLAKSLLGSDRSGESRSQCALADYLGLGAVAGSGAPAPLSMQAAAEAHGLTRAAVYLALDSSIKRWRRNTAFNHASDVVHELLEARGGVATMQEIALAIATRLPTDGSGGMAERVKAGFAVALAVVEAERRTMQSPRYELRRADHRAFLVAAGLDVAAPYAVRLGAVADKLVDPSQPVLPGPTACLAELRSVARPPALQELANERLLALAAAVSANACLNSRGELYPRGLDVRRALKLSQGAVAGLGDIDRVTRRRAFTANDLRERVAQRYPEAAPLPDAPECIPIVKEALGAETEYEQARGLFLVRSAESMTVQTGSGSRPTMYLTQVGAHPIDAHQQAVNRANAFEHEVRAAIADRRLMVLGVQPSSFARALPRLAACFNVRPVSVDALIVKGLHAVAALRNIQIARIHEADAVWPGGSGSGNLRAVLEIVRREHVAPALLRPEAPILVSDWGLAFRYEMQGLYTELREACGSGAHPGALCVLPADDAEQAIVIDGFNFPEFDPSRILRVPGAWLRLDTATAA